MTEAMPFLQKYDITFLRPPTIPPCFFCCLFQKACYNNTLENQAHFAAEGDC